MMGVRRLDKFAAVWPVHSVWVNSGPLKLKCLSLGTSPSAALEFEGYVMASKVAVFPTACNSRAAYLELLALPNLVRRNL